VRRLTSCFPGVILLSGKSEPPQTSVATSLVLAHGRWLGACTNLERATESCLYLTEKWQTILYSPGVLPVSGRKPNSPNALGVSRTVISGGRDSGCGVRPQDWISSAGISACRTGSSRAGTPRAHSCGCSAPVHSQRSGAQRPGGARALGRWFSAAAGSGLGRRGGCSAFTRPSNLSLRNFREPGSEPAVANYPGE
jgi:hypothetical protein